MRASALLSACLILSGCNTLSGWFPGSPPQTVTQVTERETAVVVVLKRDECIFFSSENKAKPAFVAPIVAAGITMAETAVADAIKTAVAQAQDNLTATYIAYGEGPIDLSKSKQFFCLDIVRGRFGPRERSAPKLKGSKLTRNNLESLGVADDPSLFVEILVLVSDDKKTVTFEPVVVQFDNTAAPNPGWPAEKDIGIMLSFASSPLILGGSTAAADAEKAATISVPIALGKMKRGTYIFTNCAQIWKPQTAQCRDLFSNQMRTVPIDATKDKPLNIYAIVTESGSPDFFDKIVLDSVSGTSVNNFLNAVTDGLMKNTPPSK